MLVTTSSRIISRQTSRRLVEPARRFLSSSQAVVASRNGGKAAAGTLMAGALAMTILASYDDATSKYSLLSAAIPLSGDVLGVITPTKEPETGLSFPALCNGMGLAGVGVRVKYVFVKVYAVGTYMDPVAMMAVKKGSPDDIEKALLDPTYPRTVRIVMNRGLSIEKYTAAIVEAIEPRLKGQELETLEEFKKLNPPVDLVEGAVIEMTIRGDTLLYKNAVGGVGSLKSRLFLEALCDVFYGKDPVSPTHKESVLKGIPKL